MTFANKFGMFIHWGLYSQLGLHEQAFVKWDIPRAEYEGLISRSACLREHAPLSARYLFILMPVVSSIRIKNPL